MCAILNDDREKLTQKARNKKIIDTNVLDTFMLTLVDEESY